MRKIIVLVCAIALMAGVAPATASAHWLGIGEAASAIDRVTDNWLAVRPAYRYCIRGSAHRVVCVVEHISRDCLAEITVTLRGNTRYIGYARNWDCY